MNDKVLKNVINICHDSQYPRWPVNGDPSNTFGTLELLFPISKKVRSCFIKKKIILVMFQKSIVLVLIKKESFLLCSKRIIRSWRHCGLCSIGFVYIQHITYRMVVLLIKQYFKINMTSLV